jgi:cytosine/adenosine deaminase-related metal-dependent hydrolase
MRKISANYIFTGNTTPIRNGIIVLNDDGIVLDVLDSSDREQHSLEFYNGIIVPGFVNTHCHIELSHLKGCIPTGCGMVDFIRGVMASANEFTLEEKKNKVRFADKLMYARGISVVGDVSNKSISFDQKKQSKIKYHTFIEALGSKKEFADRIYSDNKHLVDLLKKYNLSGNIVPHSTYSLSSELLNIICKKFKPDEIFSVHNQESSAENNMFLLGKGEMMDFVRLINPEYSEWIHPGTSSSGYLLNFIPDNVKTLLVHNTEVTKEDVDRITKSISNTDNLFWVMCPRSNMYIHNKVVDYKLFKSGNICLGTDSFASNEDLSILSEMIMLHKMNPEIELAEMIKWATFNGAKALNVDKEFGTISKGKKPGINLISKVDLTSFTLREDSFVRRLL